jgi:hypothetical protein
MPLKYIPELAARSFKSNAGIYVISEHPPSKRGIKLVKIGRSIDLRKRLNSYHICFPEGFHVWMVIKLSPETLKLTKKERIHVTKVLEQRVFLELMHINLVNDARRFHEYFKITTSADFELLKESIERVSLGARPYTEYPPIVDWRHGTAYDHFLIEGEVV